MRLTESVDFLTRKRLDRESPYTHLQITDALKEVRRQVRAQIRKAERDEIS